MFVSGFKFQLSLNLLEKGRGVAACTGKPGGFLGGRAGAASLRGCSPLGYSESLTAFWGGRAGAASLRGCAFPTEKFAYSKK